MSKNLACSNWCQLNSKGSSDAYLLCLNKCPQEGVKWSPPSSLTFTGKTTSGVSVPSPVATASKTISSSSITRLLPTKPAPSLVIAGKASSATAEQSAPLPDSISPSLDPGPGPGMEAELPPSWLSQNKLLVAGIAAAAIFAGVMVVRSRKRAVANGVAWIDRLIAQLDEPSKPITKAEMRALKAKLRKRFKPETGKRKRQKRSGR
ncbi:MAG: hypothetical protein WC683_02415 [bacterium]